MEKQQPYKQQELPRKKAYSLTDMVEEVRNLVKSFNSDCEWIKYTDHNGRITSIEMKIKFKVI